MVLRCHLTPVAPCTACDAKSWMLDDDDDGPGDAVPGEPDQLHPGSRWRYGSTRPGNASAVLRRALRRVPGFAYERGPSPRKGILEMAVVMTMLWAGVTPEQYDAVRDTVRWEQDTPAGAVLHVASFDGGALHVTDVWDSQADFERFFSDRLAAAVKQAGIEGEPQTSFTPLHRRFVAPGITGAGS